MFILGVGQKGLPLPRSEVTATGDLFEWLLGARATSKEEEAPATPLPKAKPKPEDKPSPVDLKARQEATPAGLQAQKDWQVVLPQFQHGNTK